MLKQSWIRLSQMLENSFQRTHNLKVRGDSKRVFLTDLGTNRLSSEVRVIRDTSLDVSLINIIKEKGKSFKILFHRTS